jgi:N-acetylglucosaminyl-diphospho-decaprenol L-rhamnosyltransferase
MRTSTAKLDIAVVIVSYRCAPLTVACLRSLEAERAAPDLSIRAVVVDNASGDLPALMEAVRTHGWGSWVSLVRAPRNGGFAYGNNLGIEHACTRRVPAYLYLLNPDTEVRPGAIGALVRFLEAHPEVGIAGSSFENVDGSEWPIAFRFPTLFSELDTGLKFGLITRVLRPWIVSRQMSRTAEPVDWISGASMLIRPAVLATIGGLDENYFLYFEETDFCYRARQAGFSTWYVPESRVMHLVGQSTSISDRHGRPARLPSYWFESRRRYFAVTSGVRTAMLVDLLALLAHSLGICKRIALGRAGTGVPHFLRDLIRQSVLWPRNRQIPPARCSLPSLQCRT